jgi:Flp pilus assembly protein TadD
MLLLAGCSSMQPNVAGRVPSLRVADAALEAGAPELALRVADLMLARDPRNPEALIAKGDALYASGQREEAGRAYRQAVEIEPTSAAAQLGLGRTLVQSDPAAAERAFSAAVAVRPDDSAALNDLGIARDLLGHHAAAQEAYRQALALAPGPADVKVNLGLSLALSGDKDAAIEVLREAAASPEVVQSRSKELASALALAGDDVRSRQILAAGSASAMTATAEREARGAVAPEQAAPVVASRSATSPELRRPEARLAEVPPDVARAPIAVVARASLAPLPDAAREAIAATAPLHAPHGEEDAAGSDPMPAAQALDTGAYVQLASVHSLDDARYEWRRLSRRFPDLLGDHSPVIVRTDASSGQTYWCLRTFGFADLADATGMCAAAHSASSLRCFARVAS